MNTADDLLRRVLKTPNTVWFEAEWAELNEVIRAYLDAPEMKDDPVAWGVFEDDQIHDVMFSEEYAVEQAGFKGDHAVVKPLYLHPPTKTAPMKPMTEEELDKHSIWADDPNSFAAGVRFAERHHGITDVRDQTYD